METAKEPYRWAKLVLCGGGLALAIVVLLVLLVPEYTVGQRINMRLAREHQPHVTETLAGDAEFEKLRIGVHTGSGGSIIVYGYLPSVARFDELRERIDATNPPVAVVYAVRHSELGCNFADFEPSCDDEEYRALPRDQAAGAEFP